VTPGHLWRRIVNAMAPGTINQVDDTGTVATVQVQVGYQEVMDGKPLLQQFGFSSVPPIGSDAMVMFIAGDRSNGVVLGTNHQSTRPTGRQPGETTVFNSTGMWIYLSSTGVVINGGGMPVRVMNGDLHVDGNIVWQAATTPTTAETHKHHDIDGSTDTPTGPPIPGT
jgi:phage gp45-like